MRADAAAGVGAMFGAGRTPPPATATEDGVVSGIVAGDDGLGSAGASDAAAADEAAGGMAGLPQDGANHLHEYGTFGQVHNVVRMDDTGGATLIVMGHRRLRRTGVVRTQPLALSVAHLKDEPYDAQDDIVKATANEVVSTIKELLRLNPLHKEQLAYFAQHVSDFQDPAKLADLGASMCSADEAALQEARARAAAMGRGAFGIGCRPRVRGCARLSAARMRPPTGVRHRRCWRRPTC